MGGNYPVCMDGTLSKTYKLSIFENPVTHMSNIERRLHPYYHKNVISPWNSQIRYISHKVIVSVDHPEISKLLCGQILNAAFVAN